MVPEVRHQATLIQTVCQIVLKLLNFAKFINSACVNSFALSCELCVACLKIQTTLKELCCNVRKLTCTTPSNSVAINIKSTDNCASCLCIICVIKEILPVYIRVLLTVYSHENFPTGKFRTRLPLSHFSYI